MVLAWHERERNDTTDVHFRPKNVHIQAQFGTDGFDVFETLLVVGAGATDPDLHLVLDEKRRDFAEGADDAFEG